MRPAQLPVEAGLAACGSSLAGSSESVAAARRIEFGPNPLAAPRRESRAVAGGGGWLILSFAPARPDLDEGRKAPVRRPTGDQW